MSSSRSRTHARDAVTPSELLAAWHGGIGFGARDDRNSVGVESVHPRAQRASTNSTRTDNLTHLATICRLRSLILVLAALGCGSSATTSGGSANDGSVDGTTETDVAVDTAPVTCTSGTETVTVKSNGDTSITEFCAGTICYGRVDFVQVGAFKAGDSGFANTLLRFPIDGSRTAASAILVLHARPMCSQCGTTGAPPRAGSLVVYPMRSDWDEYLESVTPCGVDRCHRTGGPTSRGWGPDRPASISTRIERGVDFGPDSTTQAITDGSASIEVALPARLLAPYSASGAGAVAFFLDAPTGLFVAASHENGTDGPELRITYCK